MQNWSKFWCKQWTQRPRNNRVDQATKLTDQTYNVIQKDQEHIANEQATRHIKNTIWQTHLQYDTHTHTYTMTHTHPQYDTHTIWQKHTYNITNTHKIWNTHLQYDTQPDLQYDKNKHTYNDNKHDCE